MKKRFLAMTMAAVLGLSLVGCGSSSTGAKAESKADSGQTAAEGSGEAADSEGKSPIKVAVVYSGNLGDKSYNDSCNAGAQQAAKDFGVEVKNLEGTTADEWEANLLACCEGDMIWSSALTLISRNILRNIKTAILTLNLLSLIQL